MTPADFTAIQDFARARGAVARQMNPLVLVITTPYYAETNTTLGGGEGKAETMGLDLGEEPVSAPGHGEG